MTDEAEEPITLVVVRHEPVQADVSRIKFVKPEVVEQKVGRIKVVTEVVKSRPVRIVHKSSNDDQ